MKEFLLSSLLHGVTRPKLDGFDVFVPAEPEGGPHTRLQTRHLAAEDTLLVCLAGKELHSVLLNSYRKFL